jgi:hypothetical protein
MHRFTEASTPPLGRAADPSLATGPVHPYVPLRALLMCRLRNWCHDWRRCDADDNAQPLALSCFICQGPNPRLGNQPTQAGWVRGGTRRETLGLVGGAARGAGILRRSEPSIRALLPCWARATASSALQPIRRSAERATLARISHRPVRNINVPPVLNARFW